MTSGRRVRLWPAMVLAGVFALLGIWAFVTAQHRMGLTVDEPPSAQRGGSAQVQSCSRHAAYMWITWTCDAQVRWNDEQAPVAERVTSVRELHGTVEVDERIVPVKRFSTARQVVPADFPAKRDGALFFVMMMGFPAAGMAAGYLGGIRLARLLPEPPEKPRELTLRSKMTDKRGRDARFNGPRRRRRR